MPPGALGGHGKEWMEGRRKMSLIKWKKREITTAICSMILVLLNTWIFHEMWMHFYSPLYYIQFYSIGRYAATMMCFGLYILLGRLYGTFWLKISRISEIMYANIVTNVMVGGAMYLVAWVFIRHLPNILPMILIICMWTLVTLIWVKPAIAFINHYCAVERIAVIYDENHYYRNAKIILNRLGWRFQVVDEISANQNTEDIMKRLRIVSAEAVMICDMSVEKKNEILKFCALKNLLTYVQPNANDYLTQASKAVRIGNLPFMCCQKVSNANLYTTVKRFLDIVLGIVGLIVATPVMIVIALMVKKEDGGPIFVKEKRLTLHKKEFTIYKFRATKLGIVEKDFDKVTIDEKLTKTGRFIRRWKLDGLPKLINVVKGDIALVGPRPEILEDAIRFEKELPEYALKYQVKAGLTGYVQIYGRYSTCLADRLQMDLLYMSQQSLAWDMKMLLATIKVIFLPEGMDLILEEQRFTKEKVKENGYCGQVET